VKPISSWTAAEASVHRLRAAFDAAALSLTVGAEEEVMLVTADGTQLVAGVEAILLHLDLPHRPPPVAPARGPPQAELVLRSDARVRSQRWRARAGLRVRSVAPEDWDL
jgi:hypothetical protein